MDNETTLRVILMALDKNTRQPVPLEFDRATGGIKTVSSEPSAGDDVGGVTWIGGSDALGTSAASIFSAGTDYALVNISVTNYHTSNDGVTSLYLLPSDVGAVANQYHLMLNTTLIPGETLSSDNTPSLGGLMIPQGYSIWGVCDQASTVSVSIFGRE